MTRLSEEQYRSYGTEVLPGFLFLTSHFEADDPTFLREHRISHVLNVCDDYNPTAETQRTCKVLHIPIRESPFTDVHARFEEAFTFLDCAKRAGGRALVHCAEGRNRSATFVLAYVMRHEGLNLGEAFGRVHRVRSLIDPNIGYRKQLRDFEVEFLGPTAPLSMPFDEETCCDLLDLEILTVETLGNYTDLGAISYEGQTVQVPEFVPQQGAVAAKVLSLAHGRQRREVALGEQGRVMAPRAGKPSSSSVPPKMAGVAARASLPPAGLAGRVRHSTSPPKHVPNLGPQGRADTRLLQRQLIPTGANPAAPIARMRMGPDVSVAERRAPAGSCFKPDTLQLPWPIPEPIGTVAHGRRRLTEMPPKLVDEAVITFRQENPKRAGSKAYERYERYKTAKTVAEALTLGCVRADIANDVKQGFCSVHQAGTDPEIVVPTPARSGGYNGQSIPVPPANVPAADVESRAQSPKLLANPKADVAAAGKKRSVDEIEGALETGPAVTIRRSMESSAEPLAAAPVAVPAAPVLASNMDLTSPPAEATVPATTMAPALCSATTAIGDSSMATTKAVVPSSDTVSVATKSERSRFNDIDLSFAKFDGKPLKFVKRAMGEAKRLLCEQGLQDAKQGGYEFCLKDKENLSKWSAKLFDLNPSGHLTQDLAKHRLEPCIDLEFCLPDGYPLEPPFARVVYPQLRGGYVFHHGGICFEPLTTKGWAPSMTLPALAIAIKGILDYGDVRVAGAGNRETRTVPQYTEQGARKDHMGIVAAHKDGASNTYSSLKSYSS